MQAVSPVDQDLLDEVTQRICSVMHPEKIVLFGSWAQGTSHTGSDLDLLIIAHSNEPRWKRAIPIYDALRGLLIPKDVVVYTPAEVAEWADVPQAFVTTALREGVILYEKK